MRLLLDTHILLWALSNDPKLSVKARKLIENDENEIYYSILSLWEVELKRIVHPDKMPISAEELAGYCNESGFHKLLLFEKHIYMLGSLQREENAPPHKDPFDRLLICQAAKENMMFVTHDPLLSAYKEPSILVV